MTPRLLFVLLCLVLFPQRGSSFCGFYVAKAGAELFNQSSQVVMVRDGNRTAITMAGDYKGDPNEFALVVPVPEVLGREQIHVGNRALVQRLDAFSAPRLVEYFDPDPCLPQIRIMRAAQPELGGTKSKSLGVTIEARYVIGEYEILILSAQESKGLEKWLQSNKYQIPKGAAKALKPYIRMGMKFFVAKVNLQAQQRLGFKYLRPIQFAFESPKFMLPIRLGMLNAHRATKGKSFQDMLVYVITKKGRVETTNYRTAKLPSGQEVPSYIKGRFSEFYRAVFETALAKEKQNTVFLEYGWNLGWCDPCAADPLTEEELRKLGVFWLGETSANSSQNTVGWPGGGKAVPAYLTRLHVRYSPEHFPEDLFFQETKDTSNFQGRYVVRHPWTGKGRSCAQLATYTEGLGVRREKEAQTLARLTNWPIKEIRKELAIDSKRRTKPKWYERIFK